MGLKFVVTVLGDDSFRRGLWAVYWLSWCIICWHNKDYIYYWYLPPNRVYFRRSTNTNRSIYWDPVEDDGCVADKCVAISHQNMSLRFPGLNHSGCCCFRDAARRWPLASHSYQWQMAPRLYRLRRLHPATNAVVLCLLPVVYLHN